MRRLTTEVLSPAGVESQEDKEQDSESPEGRTTIAEERQRNTDNRRQTGHHTNVDEEVEEEDGRHAITIDTAEEGALPLRKYNQTD